MKVRGLQRTIKQLESPRSSFAYLCAGSKFSDVWLSLDKQPPVTVPLHNFQREKANRALTLALDEGYEFKSLKSGSLTLTPPEDSEQDSRQYRARRRSMGSVDCGLKRAWTYLRSGSVPSAN